MTETTEQPSGLTPEQARQLVAQAGSIDKAAKLGGFPVGRFRSFCKANGISAVKTGGPLVSVFEEDNLPREALLAQENKELRAALRKASEIAVRDERLLDIAREILPALKPKYKPRRKDLRKHKATPHEAVLLWGDVHAGEVITEAETGGLNSYDWQTMLDRHDQITNSLLSFRDHRPYEIPKLHIAALGDLHSGIIHDLSETNEKVILDATLQLGLDMANWIERLVPEYEEIEIVGVPGNHARREPGPPKTKNVALESFDWLSLEIMKLRLAGYPSVTVKPSRSPYAVMPVLGRNFFLFHGDGVRSTNGIPAVGLLRRIREYEKTFHQFGYLDYFACGHFHTAQVLDQGRVFVNGSVVGPNGYSLRNYGGGSAAQQTLLMVHPSWGITEVLPIDLQHRPEGR